MVPLLRPRNLLSWLRRHEPALIALTAAVAFGLGVAGFRLSHERPVDAVYLTLRLFILEFDEEKSPSWAVEVARFLAPATTAAAGVKALLSLFGAQLEKARVSRRAGHVVVCGLGRRGLCLVEGLVDKGERVVAIERVADAPSVSAARLRGALVVVGDARAPAVLRQARVERARALVALGSDDDTNLEIATAVDGLSRSREGLVPQLLVHVAEEELWRALRERAVREASSARRAPEFFNVFDRGARAMLRRHPPSDDSEAASRSPHLLVVGLERLGSILVVAAARLWATLDEGRGPRLRLTVVDPDASTRLARLCLRYPLERHCDIVAVDADVRTPAFEAARFLFDEVGEVAVSRIYVCLEDELACLAAGLVLGRRLGGDRVPVVVQVMSEPASLGRFLAGGEAPGRASHLELFGLVEQTCTPELLFETTTETLAQALHERYVRQQMAAGITVREKPNLVEWEHLAERAREDTRAQARHVGAKLAAVGCDVRLLEDWDAPLVEFDADEVERLAQMEHERWVAARRAEGYRPGPRQEATRHHPDLVPWAELSEQAREIDREFVRDLPVLLARAGFQVYRRPLAAPAQRMEPSGG
jgi:voltage-gated potassium channel Kch